MPVRWRLSDILGQKDSLSGLTWWVEVGMAFEDEAAWLHDALTDVSCRLVSASASAPELREVVLLAKKAHCEAQLALQALRRARSNYRREDRRVYFEEDDD